MPFNVPFNPFGGGPGGAEGGYGGSGLSGSGPGGGPPMTFRLGPPTDANGNALGFACTFCSTGTDTSHSSADYIHCEPLVSAGLTPWPMGVPAYQSLGEFAAFVGRELCAPDIMEESQNCETPSDNLTTPRLAVGEEVPDFKLPNSDNQLVSLRHWRNQQILLVFGDTRCPHCATLIPRLNELCLQADENSLKVIFVALGADKTSARDFIEDYGIRFEVLLDHSFRVAHKFGVKYVPETFLIDTDGHIRAAGTDQHSLIQALMGKS